MQVLAWLRSLLHPVRRLLPALLCLAAAAEAFAYLGPGRVDRSMAADSLALAERIQAGSVPLRRRLRDLSAAPAPGNPDPGTPPLRQVAALANEAGIRIVRLVPRSKEEALLDAEIAGGFQGFLQFVRGIETMGGALHGWQLRPAGEGGQGAGKGADSRAITFTLDMRGRLPRPAAPAVSAEDARLRDPFRPPLPPAQAAGVVDLSGQYRLTAVSQFGAAAMATIDGRDYLQDDKLGDMVITSIQDGAVSLSAGGQHYRLGFTQSRTQRSACTQATC